ncbi:hypothetical protein DJ010_19270 [Nocardioides silvaticus]|uniref:Uncharacterized protein n=1 Tax=Nocardioides silvaticus TaxID=2201891 RepID=A0A316TAF0_9ACTN|nr:hypothetical protein [Nocardioides silvaticus]PWN01303.1 hypothetical protein DJ010_19270 [Nocardioides silvaticus]
MKHTRTRLLLAVPAALLAATSFVGCGLAEDAAKDAVEDAAKSEGVDLNLDDAENGNIEIDTTDGGVTTGKLPKDFPTDEVSVVDGEILGGTSTKNPSTWNATIEVGPAGGDKQAAYDDAAATLGLDVVQEPIDNGTSITGTYTSASYTVILAVTDSNGIVVNYTISPK